MQIQRNLFIRDSKARIDRVFYTLVILAVAVLFVVPWFPA